MSDTTPRPHGLTHDIYLSETESDDDQGDVACSVATQHYSPTLTTLTSLMIRTSTEEIGKCQGANENSPRRREIKVRKNEMKLRKNEIKVPKNFFVPL